MHKSRLTAVVVLVALWGWAGCAPPPPGSGVGRARAALDSVVPAGWGGAVDLGVRGGSTSMTFDSSPVRIEVGRDHLDGSWAKLRFVMAHEWGHVVALRWGTRQWLGAPPAGWPGSGDAEWFANCVAEVLVTDYWQSAHGRGRCEPAWLDWLRAWLAAGPPR